MNLKIGIILPTRGLIFSEVIEAIERERNLINEKTILYTTTDKPIPEAQNFLIEKALEDHEITHVISVEEDTVPFTGSFAKLLQNDGDIVAIDYGVSGWSCIAKDQQGEILWCGLGCTLIKRTVFEALEKPWFRTDKSLRLNDWQWIDNPAKYGGQDIWFCQQAKLAGFKISQVDGECKHLQLDNLGKKDYNNGMHQISQKPMIKKHQIIEERREYGF